MAGRFHFHVVFSNDADRWQVKNNGNIMSSHITKDAAVDAGVVLAKKHLPSSLHIHKMNGEIESERSYGTDPYPPKG